MKHVASGLPVAVALVFAFTTGLADTLERSDGSLVEGRFVGGTRNSVRFQVGEQVKVFPLDDVLALTFSQPSRARNGRAATRRSAPSVVVPAGSRVVVRLLDAIDSSEDVAGSRFTAVLDSGLEAEGRLIAPSGSKVYGRLSAADRGGRVAGRAALRLELTDLIIDDRAYPIVTGEFAVEGRNQGTAKKTLGGALLGAIIDGDDGVGKGAAAGFGLSLLTGGKQVSIPDGTLIVFRLEQPLVVGT